MHNITLRHATTADAEIILSWRNEPIVRENSHNNTIISLDEHLTWFFKKLADQNYHLLIAESHHTPVGVLCFDVVGNAALTNIYLKPNIAGKGIGTAILQKGCQWLKEHCNQAREIHANILSHNKASQRAFEKADFQLSHLVYHKKLLEE